MAQLTSNLPLFVAGLIFCTLFLLSVSVILYVSGKIEKREIIRKVKEGEFEAASSLAEITSPSQGGGVAHSMLSILDGIGKGVLGKQPEILPLRRLRFLRAGMRGENIPSLFWGARILTGFLLCTVTLLGISSALGQKGTLFNSFLLSLCVGFIGLYLPDLWLKTRAKRRKRRILEGFPDALDLVVVCLEAGIGLDAAFHRVGEEIRDIHRDLSDELKLFILEMRAGKARRDALKDLAERTDLEEVKSLVILMIQTDKFGTSAATALRTYSEDFRLRRHQRAEEKATKLPVKMIIPMILCILPAMVTAILGPIAIQVFDLWKSMGH